MTDFALSCDRVKRWVWLGMLLLLSPVGGRAAEEPGRGVVVVYNARVGDSRKVARHYAAVRGVPERQVMGLELPEGETLTRAEYEGQLERPLLARLLAGGFLEPPGEAGEGRERGAAGRARMRYLVLCYGVPVKILPDAGLVELGATNVVAALRRNEAAVDSELAALPQRFGKFLTTGAAANPAYGCTNVAALDPTNGVLMVARLDGPTFEVANGLVDKAVAAERSGLWGRGYFDWRGVTNQGYVLGDTWIRAAAAICRQAGFETEVDEAEATFRADHPVSQVAFYAGWYDAGVSGPWGLPRVEFMPGAFAYHLHSFSAATLRSPTAHWVGPLLARGASASVGYTAEPYLQATLDLGVFWSRFVLRGYSYGEAVYSGLPALSWQATVVGDPLYRPFAQPDSAPALGGRLRMLHQQLEASRNPLLAWSHLQVVNLNLAGGAPPTELIQYVTEAMVPLRSSVLAEKLGDMQMALGDVGAAVAGWSQGLEWSPTPNQGLRLRLKAGGALETKLGEPKRALEMYRAILRDSPDFAGRGVVLERAAGVARAAGDPAADSLRAELERVRAGN